MSQELVILGTNREESNTKTALQIHLPYKNYDLVQLSHLHIEHYQYGPQKPKDDFLTVVEKMLLANTIVFATPVYWYAMSAHMKIFFDRFSDLITTQKPMGKALKGKTTLLFATGYDDQLPEGFEVPFRRTSEYFDMNFDKTLYVSVKN